MYGRPGLDSRLSTAPALCDLLRMAKTKKNAAAVALGRLGGLKGGKARARMLTQKQRSAVARKAAGALAAGTFRPGGVRRGF
jgi:hypothetical protein